MTISPHVPLLTAPVTFRGVDLPATTYRCRFEIPSWNTRPDTPTLCVVYPPWNEHTTWNTRLFQDEFQFGKASYQMPCESFGECMGKVLFWNEDERNLELWNWNSKNKCEEYDTLKTLKCKVKTYTVYPFFGSFFVDSQQNNMFKWKSQGFEGWPFPTSPSRHDSPAATCSTTLFSSPASIPWHSTSWLPRRGLSRLMVIELFYLGMFKGDMRGVP